MQAGEVIVLATGGIVNFGVSDSGFVVIFEFIGPFSIATPDFLKLNQLNGRGGLKGWQWMFIVQGLVRYVIEG